MALRSDFKINAITPQAPPEEPQGKIEIDESALGYKTLIDERSLLSVREFTEVTHREREEREPHVPRVAILVTHGMGQQVPFETLSAIGQALITEHSRRDDAQRKNAEDRAKDDKNGAIAHSPPAETPTVNVRRVQLTRQEGAPELSRAEVRFRNCEGRAVDVHVYESYWAPLTEGQISFLATVSFLFSAGWNGIKSYFTPGYCGEHGKRAGFAHFDRWMFGDFHAMPIKRGTFMGLIWAMISAVVVLAPPVLLFTAWGLGELKEYYNKYKSDIIDHFQTANHWEQAATVLVVLLFVVFAYWVRYFMVEFVGDVAIYVSSYKVSRYDEIRNKILDAAKTVSRQIYAAGMDGGDGDRYDAVVIVGHSLGSVISYDLLNAAINWDEVENDFKYKVVERTRRFITFGSPLDKTAFLFRTQVVSDRNLREALAARQQPLILNYQQYRPESFHWVNIYSLMDVVSGHLDYYDLPSDPDCRPIENVIDWGSWIPLLAHTQYWKKEKLHQELFRAVCESAREFTPEGGDWRLAERAARIE